MTDDEAMHWISLRLERDRVLTRLRAAPQDAIQRFSFLFRVLASASVAELRLADVGTPREQLMANLAAIDALPDGARDAAMSCWFSVAWSQLEVVDVQARGARAASGDGLQRQIKLHIPSFDPVVWTTGLLAQLRRVCRIEIDDRPRGTGFLVGPDLVMTNHHVVGSVIAAQATSRRIGCRFEHWARIDHSVEPGIRVRLAESWPHWHVDSTPPTGNEASGQPLPSDDELDFALLRLERRFGDEPMSPDGPRRGWVYLCGTEPAFPAGGPLAIVQHPMGLPVKLAFDTSAILSVNANRTRVRYATNTDPGASGSPCFDAHWNLVAVHHFGDPHHLPPTYNQGIPSHKIHERLVRAQVAGLLGGPC
jgi:hypothetical protein